ncbi:HpaII family restriction endonuclease [Enterococcus sp. LJL51]|uniref:HpaII family restriction endonuclease n=1 Tax=Enterococcus sp. LJL51 TaxID=3416656 RepID=UPI003CECBB9B
MVHKYNKGEWSELYAFLYSLANGELYGADENLFKDSAIRYDIISAFQSDNEYFRNISNSTIDFEIQGKLYTVPFDIFQIETKKLFESIKNGVGSTFAIPNIEPFIENLKIHSLKAGNKLKGDLVIKVHDVMTSTQPKLSFSVKSYIGGRATLLNSSNGTSFTYNVVSASDTLSIEDIEEINNINGSSKIKDRIAKIYEKGAKLEFESVSSDIFSRNLQMIDYRMPELLSYLFEESYFVKGKRIPEVLNSYVKKTDENKEIIEYKIKQLLVACALGMVPKTPWHGLDEATGGYIVVKDNAEVLCYHIYDRNKLSQYLYTHTSFDTPSTSRYKNVGKIVLDAATHRYKFCLNLQIRF